jgi:hypothetical protein
LRQFTRPSNFGAEQGKTNLFDLVVLITVTDGAATGPKRLLAGWAGLGIVAVLSFVVLFLLVALFDSLRTSNQQTTPAPRLYASVDRISNSTVTAWFH